METSIFEKAITSPAGTFNLGELVNILLSSIRERDNSLIQHGVVVIVTSSPHQSSKGISLPPSFPQPQPQIPHVVKMKLCETEIQ